DALVMDAEQTLHHVEQEIPFSQYCEMSEDYDEQEVQVTMCITGAELEPDSASQGKLLLMNVQLLAQCLVSTVRSVEVCEDAYAVKAKLQPQWSEMEFEGRLDRQQLHSTARATLTADASQMVCTCATLGAPYCERRNGSVHICVPVYMQILYRDRDGQLQSAQSKTEALAETAFADGASCIVQADCCRVTALTGAGQIELRCEVEMDVQTFAKQSLHCLCGGTLEPMQSRSDLPSVIVRRCRARQTLWDLAKQYGTTAEAIRTANHLTGESTQADAILLIPM
ncbi:MAG: LysM peptidoglycan-binding domain-containing protein, partial [Oscillospiraceae bacterium]|nr:LysM peptidoglycan-binding domain-containing protein [Oscillospiraceae bacterium]